MKLAGPSSTSRRRGVTQERKNPCDRSLDTRKQPQITIFNVKGRCDNKSDLGATTATTMSSIPVITNSENLHQPAVARGSAAAKKGGAVPKSVLKPSNAAAGKKTHGLVLKKPSAAAAAAAAATTTTTTTILGDVECILQCTTAG